TGVSSLVFGAESIPLDFRFQRTVFPVSPIGPKQETLQVRPGAPQGRRASGVVGDPRFPVAVFPLAPRDADLRFRRSIYLTCSSRHHMLSLRLCHAAEAFSF